ncbi:MAG: FAD-dependent oxidoreductase [Desulfobacterales bacterium]
MPGDNNQQMPPKLPAIKTTELINRRWLSESAFEIELRRPPDFFFKPGQTIRLVYNDQKRYYSLVSAPDDPTVLLCANFIEKGYVSSFLASADIGHKFEFSGPHGYFTLSPSPRPPVFIATDTGIAPFASIARSGVKDFTLLHGARRTAELYYQDLLRKTARDYLQVVWDTSDADPVASSLFHGKMVDMLVQHLRPGSYDFYLCGWQKMIKDVTHMIDERYAGSHLYTEVFF